MHIIFQISEASLKAFVEKVFKEKYICMEGITFSGVTLLVDHLELSGVKLLSGGSLGKYRSVEFKGLDSSTGKVVSSNLGVPGILLEVGLKVHVISEKDVLDGKYGNTLPLNILVYFSLDCKVSGGGIQLVLKFEEVQPSQIFTDKTFDLNSLIKSKFPDQYFSFPVNSASVPGLSLGNITSAGIKLLASNALALRIDFGFTPAYGSFVPAWDSFYKKFQTNYMGNRDWTVFLSSDIFTVSMKQMIPQELSKKDIDLDSLDLNWKPNGSISISGEGEKIDACLWIDVNVEIEAKAAFSIKKPGELEVTVCDTGSGATAKGKFEAAICVLGKAFIGFIIGGVAGAVGSFLTFAIGGVLGGIGSILGGLTGLGVGIGGLISEYTDSMGCEHRVYGIQFSGKDFGTLAGDELFPTADGLAIRGSLSLKAPGAAKVMLEQSGWQFIPGVCSLPGPECSSNFLSIWNKGGAPLYVCKVYAGTNDPENVFSLNPLKSKFSDFIVQPGKKEKIRVDARVNENYLQSPYPLKLIILTCAGAYSINLGNAGKLSTTAYEQEKASFWIDPKKCFNIFLDISTDEENRIKIPPEKRLKIPPFPDFVDMFSLKTLVMYDFSLVNVPEDTELSVFEADGRLEGQIRGFRGNARLPVLMDREKAAEGLYFTLKSGLREELRRSAGRERKVFREYAGEEVEKMPKLAVRQFVWRMLGEFETGRPLSGFSVMGDRLYIASTDRVWGVDIRNPYSPVLRSQFFTEGIKGIEGCRDHLYLFSPENVRVFRLKENWNLEPIALWDYPGVRRLAFRGYRAYVLQEDALSSLDTREIQCPPLLSRIEVPNGSDLLLFGHRVAVASEEGVLLFEMEDPCKPVEIGFIRERGIHSLEKAGGALALYGSRGTVSLFGVCERGEIESLGMYNVRHQLSGLRFGKNFAFALSPESTGVQIYEVEENLERGTVEVLEG